MKSFPDIPYIGDYVYFAKLRPDRTSKAPRPCAGRVVKVREREVYIDGHSDDCWFYFGNSPGDRILTDLEIVEYKLTGSISIGDSNEQL